jgi:hypothetical protein
MVMRTIEINKLSFERKGRDREAILKKIEELFGKKLDVKIMEDRIEIQGDLRDHRKRNTLIKYLIGGK